VFIGVLKPRMHVKKCRVYMGAFNLAKLPWQTTSIPVNLKCFFQKSYANKIVVLAGCANKIVVPAGCANKIHY
jgi:hypothetical protein